MPIPPFWGSQVVTDIPVSRVFGFVNEVALFTGQWGFKKKGLSAVEIDPTVFKRDVHVKKVTELPFYYGFNVGLEVPADDVYKMLNVIEKNAADLAKTDPSFSEIARDMKGFQKRGVESSWELVPIHPGLAKWMREKGVWDKKWDSKVATM